MYTLKNGDFTLTPRDVKSSTAIASPFSQNSMLDLYRIDEYRDNMTDTYNSHIYSFAWRRSVSSPISVVHMRNVSLSAYNARSASASNLRRDTYSQTVLRVDALVVLAGEHITHGAHAAERSVVSAASQASYSGEKLGAPRVVHKADFVPRAVSVAALHPARAL